MKQIRISDIEQINKYWLVARDDEGNPKHIDLSACANSYARRHGSAGEGEMPCIGVRYTRDGVGYYELYDIGHTRLFMKLTPNWFGSLFARLQGKDPAESTRRAYEAIEAQLNENGYRTVESEGE